MKKVNIGLVVRTYDEVGNFTEIRRDHVSCDNIPDEMKKALMAGEVVSVNLMSNVEALYATNKPFVWSLFAIIARISILSSKYSQKRFITRSESRISIK